MTKKLIQVAAVAAIVLATGGIAQAGNCPAVCTAPSGERYCCTGTTGVSAPHQDTYSVPADVVGTPRRLPDNDDDDRPRNIR